MYTTLFSTSLSFVTRKFCDPLRGSSGYTRNRLIKIGLIRCSGTDKLWLSRFWIDFRVYCMVNWPSFMEQAPVRPISLWGSLHFCFQLNRGFSLRFNLSLTWEWSGGEITTFWKQVPEWRILIMLGDSLSYKRKDSNFRKQLRHCQLLMVYRTCALCHSLTLFQVRSRKRGKT